MRYTIPASRPRIVLGLSTYNFQLTGQLRHIYGWELQWLPGYQSGTDSHLQHSAAAVINRKILDVLAHSFADLLTHHLTAAGK